MGLSGWAEYPLAVQRQFLLPPDWPITIEKMKALWAVLVVTLLAGMDQGLSGGASRPHSSPGSLAGWDWDSSDASLRVISPEQLFSLGLDFP